MKVNVLGELNTRWQIASEKSSAELAIIMNLSATVSSSGSKLEDFGNLRQFR